MTAAAHAREAADGPPIVAVRHADLGYDAGPVVRDVDFTLTRGEVVALVGPNGCGKTTLVRGILGLATVLNGSIELFGEPHGQLRERARIGYVPQRHTVRGAIPCTVREVVSSGRLARRRWGGRATAADRAAVSAAVDTVGLSEHARTEVATLSGGQQRRVLIARALAGEPEALVMDEPTAGVDAASQQSLVATLTTLVEAGTTLLIVTHELTPLRPLITRVVAMEHGRIVHDGPPDDALAAGYAEHHPGHDEAHSLDPPSPPVGAEPTSGVGIAAPWRGTR